MRQKDKDNETKKDKWDKLGDKWDKMTQQFFVSFFSFSWDQNETNEKIMRQKTRHKWDYFDKMSQNMRKIRK